MALKAIYTSPTTAELQLYLHFQSSTTKQVQESVSSAGNEMRAALGLVNWQLELKLHSISQQVSLAACDADVLARRAVFAQDASRGAKKN